jgi:hypothetical protein
MKANRYSICLISAAALTSLLSGCVAMQPLVTQPSLDVTKAPFKASTDLSEAPFRASNPPRTLRRAPLPNPGLQVMARSRPNTK